MLWPEIESEVPDIELLLAISAESGKLMWFELFESEFSSDGVDGRINEVGICLSVGDCHTSSRNERARMMSDEWARENARARG